MLPASVEPRAKMKVTSLQGPFCNSLEVLEDWRSTIVVAGSGFAVMVLTRAAKANDWNFMLYVEVV